MIVSDFLIGTVGLSVGSGLSIPGSAPVGVVCAGSFSFLSGISTLIASENISKVKIRFTKLRDWIHVITLIYERTLKKSIVDEETY